MKFGQVPPPSCVGWLVPPKPLRTPSRSSYPTERRSTCQCATLPQPLLRTKRRPSQTVGGSGASCPRPGTVHRFGPLRFCDLMADLKETCQFSREPMASLRNLWIRTQSGACQQSWGRGEHTGRALGLPGSSGFQGGAPLLCLEEGRRREGSDSGDSWFPSDGRGLKAICPLFSMVLTGWVTAVPIRCPWHCAFPLVTVKSRSHWTQRPESRTISPPLEPVTSSYS